MTKLSQQNKFVLPVCFAEHCPALPAVVNEIQFQKPIGKKTPNPSLCSTLSCRVEQTTESSFETAVRALFIALPVSPLVEAIACVPFNGSENNMKYHSHLYFMQECLLPLT